MAMRTVSSLARAAAPACNALAGPSRRHISSTRLCLSTARPTAVSPDSPSSNSSTSTPTAQSTVEPSIPGQRQQTFRSSAAPSAVFNAPPLSRPLGSDFPPQPSNYTWNKELKEEERRKREADIMFRESGRGYYHDLNIARKTGGGKLWKAPEVLIREDMAKYFPNIAGNTLDGRMANTTNLLSGRTSLVAILNTRLSEEQVASWSAPVLDDQAGKAGFRFVQINYQENALKSMLSRFFTASLKRTVPEARWPSYLMANSGWTEVDITGPLGIANKLISFIYLVDHNCKVRWAACGPPQEAEIQSLRQATAVLMDRSQLKDGFEMRKKSLKRPPSPRI